MRESESAGEGTPIVEWICPHCHKANGNRLHLAAIRENMTFEQYRLCHDCRRAAHLFGRVSITLLTTGCDAGRPLTPIEQYQRHRERELQ